MQVGVVGVNFKTAPLSVREALSRAGEESRNEPWIILSTCNRIEVYFSGEDLATIQMEVLGFFRHLIDVEFEPYLYSYFGIDAFEHLARVASGLDSALIGESEIQRQVKIAYNHRREAVKLDKALHFLFQKSLHIGKQMRTQFIAPHKKNDLGSIVGKLIRLLKPQNNAILFIGNSMINRHIHNSLKFMGIVERATFCSRTQCENIPNIERLEWSAIEDWNQYSIVICGAKHDGFVLKDRKIEGRQILFDLGVPRNIDPRIGSRPGISLYNIDDLATFGGTGKQRHISVCEEALEQLARRHHNNFLQKHYPQFPFQVVPCAN